MATTLDETDETFRASPSNKTAGDYLIELMGYYEDDMIGDDTFLNGLADIAHYLVPDRKLGGE